MTSEREKLAILDGAIDQQHAFWKRNRRTLPDVSELEAEESPANTVDDQGQDTVAFAIESTSGVGSERRT